eukprot:EG_transcript_18228
MRISGLPQHLEEVVSICHPAFCFTSHNNTIDTSLCMAENRQMGAVSPGVFGPPRPTSGILPPVITLSRGGLNFVFFLRGQTGLSGPPTLCVGRGGRRQISTEKRTQRRCCKTLQRDLQHWTGRPGEGVKAGGPTPGGGGSTPPHTTTTQRQRNFLGAKWKIRVVNPPHP